MLEPGVVCADDLDLTPQQVAAMKELQKEFQLEQQEILQRIREARLELKTLNREEYRGEKGEILREEIRNLMLRARERSLYYRQRALGLLTPEQRDKIPPESSLGFHCRGPYFRGGWGQVREGRTR